MLGVATVRRELELGKDQLDQRFEVGIQAPCRSTLDCGAVKREAR